MGTVTLNGESIEIEGGFLKPGNLAPDFALCGADLETKTLGSFQGKIKVIATVPSIDTNICALESKEINDLAIKYPSVVFLIISKDLPFALDRFCKSTHLHNIIPLSDLRSRSGFAKNYGVKIASGPLDGLLTRSIFILDQSDKVIYSDLMEEITAMPNFKTLEKALEGME